jgi:hypothetical protein
MSGESHHSGLLALPALGAEREKHGRIHPSGELISETFQFVRQESDFGGL